jgi:hypothetical protein
MAGGIPMKLPQTIQGQAFGVLVKEALYTRSLEQSICMGRLHREDHSFSFVCFVCGGTGV